MKFDVVIKKIETLKEKILCALNLVLLKDAIIKMDKFCEKEDIDMWDYIKFSELPCFNNENFKKLDFIDSLDYNYPYSCDGTHAICRSAAGRLTIKKISKILADYDRI